MIKSIGMSLWAFMMIAKRKTVGLTKMRDEGELENASCDSVVTYF